jgi:hypothetical protein
MKYSFFMSVGTVFIPRMLLCIFSGPQSSVRVKHAKLCKGSDVEHK